MPLDEQLIKFAAGMHAIGETMFPRGTIVDTVAWSRDGEDDRVAWVVNPLKALNHFGLSSDSEEHINARRFSQLAQRTFGIKETGFEYETNTGIYDFLDRIRGILMGAVIEREGDYSFDFTLITSPGWPWPAYGDQYFSVKKRGIVESPRPEYLIRLPADENRGEKERWGIDFCKVLPVAEKLAEGRAVMGRLPRCEMIVSHSMRFLTDEEAKTDGESVNRCGGLLFASLAVGGTPATNFGPCVLVSYLDVVLLALKPYKPKRRGHWPIVLYDTDTWTATMSTFTKDAAEVLFDQLHGNGNWMNHFETHPWILGPPVQTHAAPFAPEGVYPLVITSTRKLDSIIRSRTSKWKRGLSSEKFGKLLEEVSTGKSRYPYLEAKSNEILSMKNFPLAICPHELESRFRIFLDAVGFEGRLITIQDKHGIGNLERGEPGMDFTERHWIEFEYAQDVADEVRHVGPTVTLDV